MKQRVIKKGGRKAWILLLLAVMSFLVPDLVLAAVGHDSGIGGVAKNITESFFNLTRLITATGFVAGMGFAVAAVLKFKAHKDNPQQIPIGTAIALIFIAAALLFLPAIFTATGTQMFGTGYTPGSVSGFTTVTGAL